MRGGPGRLFGVFLGLVTILCGAGFGPFLSTSDVGGRRFSHEQAWELVASSQAPAISARAAIVYDEVEDEILFSYNAHQRLPPASTTKILTAMLALKKLPLSQLVTVGPEVEVPGMRVGLSRGDAASVEKLLYATLMNSGNDAAAALAVAAGGTMDQFVFWMNEEAEALGLENTHFVNSHGLDAPDHYSSAYDLMVLAREALRNPIFARIVATSQTSLDGWSFINTNELLGQYDGLDGVKTGTTDAAGECLVASASRYGSRVILVVLGSADRYSDARALLDHYYTHRVMIRLDTPENGFSLLPRGDKERQRYLMVSPDEAAEAVIPRWALPWVHMVVLDAGSDAPRARFLVGNVILRELPLAVREM